MRKRPNDVEKLDQISQSINPDGKGNLTVGKNLGVDGKLTLKSLVSDRNPDGDITKELGGGGGGGGSTAPLYNHTIQLRKTDTVIYRSFVNQHSEYKTVAELSNSLAGKSMTTSGFIKYGGKDYSALAFVGFDSSFFYVVSKMGTSTSSDKVQVEDFSILDICWQINS